MTETIEKNSEEKNHSLVSEEEPYTVLDRNKTWSKLRNRYILAWQNLDYNRFAHKTLIILIISFIIPLLSPFYIAAVPSLIILYLMIESEFGSISLFEISNLSVTSGIMYFMSLLSYNTNGTFLLIGLTVSFMTIIYSLVYAYIVKTSIESEQNLKS